MFSSAVFSELPFAGLPAAALSDPGLQTFYLSTNGYTSGASDTVADQYFDARVQQALGIGRIFNIGDRIGGVVRGNGAITLANGDRGLDLLLDRFTLDGRSVTVRYGSETFSYDDFGVLFKGIMAGAVATRDDIQIEIRENLDTLDVPIQTTTYAGTGGNEGGTDLKGNPKPLCFGQVFNVPAVLVDAANDVYQVASHQIGAVTAVRDRGFALNEAPSGGAGRGEYETDLSTGLVTLGGSPDGQITVDLQGHADPSYVSNTSDIVKRILESFASFSSSDMDLPSFAGLASDSAAAVGIWIGPEQRTRADVIDELLAGIGAFGAVRRDGQFSVGVFKVPSGAPKEFADDEIMGISRELLPGSVYPPSWRQQVGWQKNYIVQTDIVGSVSAAVRSAISQPFRIAAAADASVQIDHLLATDPSFVPALYANETDASAEATRLNTLYSTGRSIYRVTVSRRGFGLELNDVVKITYPAWDLSEGKFGRIVGMDDNAAARMVELTVFV